MASSVYQLNVHFLPKLTHPHDLAGNAVVMIDVLRASTTIIHALAHGADEVIPCLEIQEARNLARKRSEAGVSLVLGGERGGKPITGFDFGNSPTDYTETAVSGKTVIFTTTNGTRALTACTGSQRVLIGSFVNLSAVAVSLSDEPAIDLLCAGTEQMITREDVLFAGALAGQLIANRGEPDRINDQARLAMAAWREVENLEESLLDSQGGRNLAAIDLADDVRYAAGLDRFDCVPSLDRSLWSIR